jgi:formylmethanofuran--tetrahydromethanopterin N-formyltransferase
LDEDSISAAMRAGIRAACERGGDRGVIGITAGNYGGKLGSHHFHLREVLSEARGVSGKG